MKNKSFRLLIMLLVVMLPMSAFAFWTAQLGSGAPYSFRSRLKIHQSGKPDIVIRHARWKTHPFTAPLYYMWRFGYWRTDKAGWELQWIHHKIYLQNKPPEIQSFSISHGYNLVDIFRVWKINYGLLLRLGAGAVVAHPENTVRCLRLREERGGILVNGGYYLAGVSAIADLAKRFNMGRHVFIEFEGAFSGAWAKVKVVDGWATVPNFAIHGIASIGLRT